ncbi:MAG: hydroxyacid dehydrogenase [Steroidobacter sp.]
MSDIVICEFMDENVVRDVFAGRDVIYDARLVDRPDDLQAALSDARALVVRNRTQVRPALLDKAPRLKVVGRLGVGLDNIDMEACKARDIVVHPATGANDLAVAEYVITAALLLLRRAWFMSARVAAGEWPRTDAMGRELAGKRLGLIGFGAIARQTARRASDLGMSICGYDPYLPPDHALWAGAQCVALNELLATSDVISLHVPLTPQTHHMIDARALAAMRSDAILINAARGGVVDESALARALKAGRPGGAALDVFEQEPLDVKVGAVFAGIGNLLLTPHIAGVTEESNVRVSTVTAEAVLRCLGT